jgi:ketosteroid isomerase-like protein
MPNDQPTMEALAERIKAALQSADLSTFRDLLDPSVRWGAPGDPAPACQNREQVLAWYQRSRDGGVRASVDEVVLGEGKLLIGLTLANARPGRDGGAERWQVLTLRNGRVVDIRGFDDRSEAMAIAFE